MIWRSLITFAASLSVQFSSGCAPMSGEQEMRRPSRDAILRQAHACGLRAENLEFSVDEEGVDNAMIFPVGTRTAQYDGSIECMMEWAARTGAALGFEFEPRGS
jgi:hypothetical protein